MLILNSDVLRRVAQISLKGMKVISIAFQILTQNSFAITIREQNTSHAVTLVPQFCVLFFPLNSAENKPTSIGNAPKFIDEDVREISITPECMVLFELLIGIEVAAEVKMTLLRRSAAHC